MSIKIETFVNTNYNSNTYLIKNKSNNTVCYIIDIGNAEEVLRALEKDQVIKGIFLTHAHYDHICGINKMIERFPNCIIYGSFYTKEAVKDSKMNLSFYHNTPISYDGKNFSVVNENQNLILFKNHNLEVIATPGHNEGSLTFKINNAIFTGDSLIPETPVVTKLKSGNKQDAKKSIVKLRNRVKSGDVLYPGHGSAIEATKIDWNYYL